MTLLQELVKINRDSVKVVSANFLRPTKAEEQQIIAYLPRDGDLPTMKDLEDDPMWFEFVEV